MAICHEWNTIAHLNDYEGNPEARPFTREELQRFLDYATIFKVIYGWGLRRTETARLDVADFGPSGPSPATRCRTPSSARCTPPGTS